MERYGSILLIAMPAFLLLVLFEKWYGWKKGNDTVRNMDMISSLSSGITNVTKDVLKLSIPILAYPWMVIHLSLFQVKSSFLVYFIAFIVIDFAGYWVHRWSHHINMFWNRHIIHHSSEEFNLACALRQSISGVFEWFFFLLIPAAVMGIPVIVIATITPLHLFAQFWYHTRHIGKMGFLERIIVTPSHHRVHHAINKEYLDKNLSQILIIWDKLFGTFQEEMEDVPCVYGITRPSQTWNPIRINFQHFWLMMKDAWYTQDWKDKFLLWFKPTGYRPPDMLKKFPVYKIDDVYHFNKYDTRADPALHTWSWIQIIFTLLLLSYFFGNIGTIKEQQVAYIYIYGAFVFLQVYAFTELMDRNKYAFVWESLKNAAGIFILFYTGDWFGLQTKFGHGLLMFTAGYFILSTIVCGWFAYRFQLQEKLGSPGLANLLF